MVGGVLAELDADEVPQRDDLVVASNAGSTIRLRRGGARVMR
jgi:hypothetical protein